MLEGGGGRGALPPQPCQVCVWLTPLPSCRELAISFNNLSGPIPGCFSTLGNLQYLDVSYNTLTGSIPSTLSALTGLQYVQAPTGHTLGWTGTGCKSTPPSNVHRSPVPSPVHCPHVLLPPRCLVKTAHVVFSSCLGAERCGPTPTR